MVATKKSALVFSLVLLLAACSKKEGSSTATGNSSSGKVLRLYTWSNYFDESMIKEFEEKSGIKVKIDYFSANEDLLAKIQASVQSGSEGYDLIMPSDYMVNTMHELALLKELDHSKLLFLKEYSEEFQNPVYDPGMKYAVPVAWGTTGVAVETSKAKGFDAAKGVSWKDLFEGPNAGQVTFLDDEKEVFNAALLTMGKYWSAATEPDIQKAFEYIKKYKKNIKAFTQETKPVMEAGECNMCMAYSGDVLRAQKARPSLKYFIPKEGATIWADNFAIPKNAASPDLAYVFMNHVLKAETAKKFTELTFFASPNEKSRALLPDALKNSAIIFPSAVEKSRLHHMQEKPDLMITIDKLWTELRSE